MLLGLHDLVSPLQEDAVRQSLRQLCHDLQRRAETALRALNAEPRSEHSSAWHVCFKTLWMEERAVASLVADMVSGGGQW